MINQRWVCWPPPLSIRLAAPTPGPTSISIQRPSPPRRTSPTICVSGRDADETPDRGDRPPAPQRVAGGVMVWVFEDATSSTVAASRQRPEEYSPYDLGCETLGAGLSRWSHEIVEAETPAAPADDAAGLAASEAAKASAPVHPRHCLLGRRTALWEAPYQFSFEEANYSLAGSDTYPGVGAATAEQESIEATPNALAGDVLSPDDRPPAPLASGVIFRGELARELEEGWEALGYRYENGQWLQHGPSVADLAAGELPKAERAVGSAVLSENENESETVFEAESSATGGAGALDAGTEAAIDRAIASAWDEVDAPYNAWREGERKKTAVSWRIWERCKVDVRRMHQGLDLGTLHAAWGRLDESAERMARPYEHWTQLALAADQGLRQHAERQAAEQEARRGLASMLRKAAVGMKQASGMLESWAEAWDGRRQAGQTDGDLRR